MKLLIIRHADPDYSIDSLTQVGWQEAELLADRMENMDVKAFYVSPMGRAKDTANVTLKRIGREAEEKDWLQEFPAKVLRPHCTQTGVAWDWLPQDWTKEPRFYDRERWFEPEVFASADVERLARKVWEGLDAVLAKHGYIRDGEVYRVEQANEDTIVFFCHFGLECVLLSHLLHISPMLLWHGTCAAPSSVTVLTTEERQEGIAHWRMNTFGDTSHLYAGGRQPSFAARFCETYENRKLQRS